MKTQIRAVIYARVSTEEQAEKGYSIEGQVDDCTKKARSLGYGAEELLVLTDEQSGGTLERPGLNRLRELVSNEAGLHHVIIYDPDRFARKLAHQLLVTDEIVRRGIQLEFVNFEWKNTPEGRMFYQLRGMFAEFEREKIRERTIRGRMTKIKRYGKLSCDPRLYGYQFDVEHDTLVVHEQERDVVQLMFAWCADGMSGESIARKLADQRIPAPRGQHWYGSTVTRILGNKTYLGTFMAYKTDYHQGYRRDRPVEEQFPIAVEPLVEERVFLQAQQTLARHRTRTGRPSERVYLSSGLGVCECGCTITASHVSGKAERAYYACSSKRKRGHAAENAVACEAPYWNAAVVDAVLWEQVRSYVENGAPFLAAWAQQPYRRDADRGNMIQWSVLEKRRSSLTKQWNKLLDLYLDGQLETNAYSSKREQLEQQQQAVEAQLKSLRLHEQHETVSVPSFAALQQALDAADASLRKDIVDLVVDHLVFGPARELTISFREGCLSGK